MHIWQLKFDSFWGPKQAPDPGLQSNVSANKSKRLFQIKQRKIAFVKMFRIFHIEIDNL